MADLSGRNRFTAFVACGRDHTVGRQSRFLCFRPDLAMCTDILILPLDLHTALCFGTIARVFRCADDKL